MSDTPVWTGGCACCSIRFQARGYPEWVGVCHCSSCRRCTGGILNGAAGFLRTAVQFTNQPKSYCSSEGVERFFCATCGSSIAYQNQQWPKDIHLFVGVFDYPENIVPEFHIFTNTRLPWFDGLSKLPQYQTIPSRGEDR